MLTGSSKAAVLLVGATWLPHHHHPGDAACSATACHRLLRNHYMTPAFLGPGYAKMQTKKKKKGWKKNPHWPTNTFLSAGLSQAGGRWGSVQQKKEFIIPLSPCLGGSWVRSQCRMTLSVTSDPQGKSWPGWWEGVHGVVAFLGVVGQRRQQYPTRQPFLCLSLAPC